MAIDIYKLLEYKKAVVNKITFDDVLRDKVELCGNFFNELKIESLSNDEKLDYLIKHDYLCRFKFCPVCNAYRGRAYQEQMYKGIKKIVDTQGKHLFFITLTVQNCKIEELSDTLDRMGNAYKTFKRNPQIAQFKSYVRTTEITFNGKEEAHPHYHIIFLADKYYFSKRNIHYLHANHHQLKQLWALHYMKDKNVSVNCDFRQCYKKDGFKDIISSAVPELSKYITKSLDLNNLSTTSFKTLIEQTKGKRFISSSRDIKLSKDIFSDLKYQIYKGQKSVVSYSRCSELEEDLKKPLKSENFKASNKQFNYLKDTREAESLEKHYLDYYGYQSELDIKLAKYPSMKKFIYSKRIKK